MCGNGVRKCGKNPHLTPHFLYIRYGNKEASNAYKPLPTETATDGRHKFVTPQNRLFQNISYICKT